MNPLTRLLVLGWVAIGGIVGANFAGVAAVKPAADTLLAYSGPVSAVSVFGGFTALYGFFAWRVAKGRVEKLTATIIRDKPAMANDPAALKRERRVREKEAKLQRAEQKALKKENRAEKKEVQATRKENKLERKREEIAMKKEGLREREQLGR